MKNQLSVVLFVVVIAVIILFAFNFHGHEDGLPISKIMQEDNAPVQDIEYEYMTTNSPVQAKKVTSEAVTSQKTYQTVTAGKTVKNVQEDKAVNNTQAVAKTGNAGAGGMFAVQVASFKQRKMAENAINDLKMKEVDARIVEKNLGAKGIWYRVCVGEFQSKDKAQEKLRQVKKDYKDSFVVSINN